MEHPCLTSPQIFLILTTAILIAQFNAILAIENIPRSIRCEETKSNGKTTLTCTGFSRIPLESDGAFPVFANEIMVLEMSAENNLQALRTLEFHNASFLNLEKFKANNANIRSVEIHAFFGLDRLAEIDLSNNKIETLNMEAFQDSIALQFLHLTGNPIHQLTGDKFLGVPKLSKLFLNKCNITKIPQHAFEDLEKLQDLHLEQNRLQRLDWNTFNSNPHHLTQVHLLDNDWNCDCHMKFLQNFLFTQRNINISPNIVCQSPAKFSQKGLGSIGADLLTCPPNPILRGIGVIHQDNTSSSDGSNHVSVYAEIGKKIGLECFVSGYPEPSINFWRNGKLLNKENKATLDENGGMEETYRFHFSKILTIDSINGDNNGDVYECITENSAGKMSQKVSLNITNVIYESGVVGGGGNQTWIWILIFVLILLLIILLVALICCVWRKRENDKHDKLKEQMMEKFKGSEIVIDDAINKSPYQKDSTTTPLLLSSTTEKAGLEAEIVKGNSKLPDVTQQRQPKDEPSLSPIVFSPRPYPADLRRQFFANQMQSGDYSSEVLPQQYGVRPMDYRMQHFPIRRPGSAQSLVHPDQYYGSRAPTLMRQFSGPAYGSLRISRRPPSIASTASEFHPSSVGSYSGYVTLPRHLPPQRRGERKDGFGRPVSPTESTCSTFSYSTLPRTGRRIDPHGLMYDSVGPRTDAGGSNLSLNKIDSKIMDNPLQSINQGLVSPGLNQGKVKSNRTRLGSNMTPNSIRGFFNFEPIQEVEGSEDLVSQLPSNAEIDKVFPKLSVESGTEPKYKKKPSPKVSIPLKSTKPTRSFEYRNLKGSVDKGYDFDESLDGDKENGDATPNFQTSPNPSSPNDKLEPRTENIAIVEAQGTEV